MPKTRAARIIAAGTKILRREAYGTGHLSDKK